MPAHHDLLSGFVAGLGTGIPPPGLTAHAENELDRRFAVYRNNVAVGLGNALSKRFAVIERLVGQDFFRALARVYLDTDRPTSAVLITWGDSFPAFLAGFAPLAAYPYMADVARIEVARGRAYHAADADPLPQDHLLAAAQDPGSLRLQLHPSVQVLHLTYSAVSIWSANQPGAQPLTRAPSGPETALILRDRACGVPVTAIGPGDAALISALQAGDTLLAAAEAALHADPGHDPQPILVRLMQAGALVSPPLVTPQKDIA